MGGRIQVLLSLLLSGLVFWGTAYADHNNGKVDTDTASPSTPRSESKATPAPALIEEIRKIDFGDQKSSEAIDEKISDLLKEKPDDPNSEEKKKAILESNDNSKAMQYAKSRIKAKSMKDKDLAAESSRLEGLKDEDEKRIGLMAVQREETERANKTFEGVSVGPGGPSKLEAWKLRSSYLTTDEKDRPGILAKAAEAAVSDKSKASVYSLAFKDLPGQPATQQTAFQAMNKTFNGYLHEKLSDPSQGYKSLFMPNFRSFQPTSYEAFVDSASGEKFLADGTKLSTPYSVKRAAGAGIGDDYWKSLTRVKTSSENGNFSRTEYDFAGISSGRAMFVNADDNWRNNTSGLKPTDMPALNEQQKSVLQAMGNPKFTTALPTYYYGGKDFQELSVLSTDTVAWSEKRADGSLVTGDKVPDRAFITYNPFNKSLNFVPATGMTDLKGSANPGSIASTQQIQFLGTGTGGQAIVRTEDGVGNSLSASSNQGLVMTPLTPISQNTQNTVPTNPPVTTPVYPVQQPQTQTYTYPQTQNYTYTYPQQSYTPPSNTYNSNSGYFPSQNFTYANNPNYYYQAGCKP